MSRAPALLFFAWLLLVVLAPPPNAGADGPYVAVGQLRGTINPAAASYVDRALGRAEADGAALFVLQLDTPGGLDSSMRQIVQRILASRVPVVVYVSPPGARAASAGVYITYSANLAAMAPNTNIGSATPVAMSESGEAKLSDEMRAKMTNDAVAYIKSLAATRGRNTSWAEEAVRQAINAPASEALELGVVNYVAADLPDLLRQLDGAQLPGVQGEGILRPSTLPVLRHEMQPLEGLMHALANPTIAYLLLSIGTLALVVELYHPGAIFPGVTGALCLLLAFYGLGTLPVNLAGVLFIVLGVALFALDVVMPTHGVLTVGGILSFLLGSAVLINAPDGAPYLAIAWQAIALVTLFFVLFFGFLLGTVVRIQSRRSVNGRETLVGQRAQVRTPLAPSGLVFVQGELWSATTHGEVVPADEWVEVLGVDGLRLSVRRASVIPALTAEAVEPAVALERQR